MEKSLKEKSLKSASWSLIDSFGSSGVIFIVGIFLARILSPEEFGIIGMIAIFIAISNSIVDSGFSSALIRKLDVNNIDYNTVFILNLFLAFFLYFILYFLAPAISIFFNTPILIPVTRAMGLIVIINSFSIIHRTILVKNINFRVQAKISLVASIVSGIVGITLALLNFGVWSLILQQLIKQFVNSVLLWLANSWRPRFEFSFKSFKGLFGFGSKLLLSGIIDTIYNNLYYVVIGKFYNQSQLGQYTRAEQFNSVFSNNLTIAIQRVSYPVFSNIQNEEERFKDAFSKVIRVTMFATFTCMLLLAAVAKPFLALLIGEKWLLAASYLQIMCFYGMLVPLHAINLNLLQVKGKSKLFLQLEIIKKIIGVLPIVLGIYYGIITMLIATVFTSIIAYFINSHYTAKYLRYSTLQQLRDIFPSFLIAFSISVIVWLISFLHLSYLNIFLFQLFVGLTITIVINEKIKLPEYSILKEYAFKLLKKK